MPKKNDSSVSLDLPGDETLRYARQTILPEVGPDGQERLKKSRVLCVGAGGLGSPLLSYLAAAGIGHLGIVDADTVDSTNLHRQILYTTDDVGQSKTAVAAARLRRMNPQITVQVHETRLCAANAKEIIGGYEIVADGTDNFAARYLVNDACVLLGKPNVFASVLRFDGQFCVFDARDGGPCYRCLFPAPPPAGVVPNCAEAGVLGALPGILGSLQALEVLKIALKIGEPLIGRLLLVDGLSTQFREIRVRKDPKCPICGDTPTITTLRDEELAVCDTRPTPEISPEMLRAQFSDVRLIDVREPHEHQAARIPGAQLIPLGTLADMAKQWEKSTPLVLHCKSGARSAQGVQLLQNLGFTNVVSLRGGILSWQAENKVDKAD